MHGNGAFGRWGTGGTKEFVDCGILLLEVSGYLKRKDFYGAASACFPQYIPERVLLDDVGTMGSGALIPLRGSLMFSVASSRANPPGLLQIISLGPCASRFPIAPECASCLGLDSSLLKHKYFPSAAAFCVILREDMA